MSYKIAIGLLVLWLAGIISGYTLGGFIHLFLAIATVLFIAKLFPGHPPQPGEGKVRLARKSAWNKNP